MPLRAKADIFSTLFGNDVSASTGSSTSSDENSQNMGLLQANVSSAAIIQDKKDKNSKDKTIDDSKTINILADNALAPATGPAGVSDGTNNADISPDQISVYVVRDGDTVATIAQMFEVTSNTILWANDLKKGDKLVTGTVLIILPVTGVQVIVAKGDTLKSIAKKYNVADVSDIAGFNGIADDAQLTVGDELIIPDGEIADNGGDTSVKNSGSTNKKQYDVRNLPVITGYFMNPVPGARLTQGLHAHGYAVDLAIAKGTPILASASGTVIFARMGSNGGFGGLVIIDHPNGTETYYAHQSRVATHVGDQVSQGEVIGYVGSTGNSTGPHVHFEIRGAQNPGGNGQVGSTMDANWK
jgi:murein DD-endopeptidase MepM/ murein hydrolase activator NlpD